MPLDFLPLLSLCQFGSVGKLSWDGVAIRLELLAAQQNNGLQWVRSRRTGQEWRREIWASIGARFRLKLNASHGNIIQYCCQARISLKGLLNPYLPAACSINEHPH
jgi:hypothetical protein